MPRSKVNKEVARELKSEYACVRLGLNLKRRLEDLADRDGRSVSNLIRHIVDREFRRTDEIELAKASLVTKINSEAPSPAELEIEAQEGLERKSGVNGSVKT